jgi:N-methylhydantoinase A/oxoprolinase/acetone carboxylase beta subunit
LKKRQSDARLAVDIGGTFTDVVLQARGSQWTTKVKATGVKLDLTVTSPTGDHRISVPVPRQGAKR